MPSTDARKQPKPGTGLYEGLEGEAWESPDGVDLSLIHWTLSLTPTQRLEVLEDFVATTEALRRGRRE